MELLCSVMNYDWGKLGKDSLVARVSGKNNPLMIINDEVPYAEYWMGTHPNGPSVIKLNGLQLEKYILENPSCLGKSEKIFGSDLPFLFKVLSIRKALSIQVHPSKELAKELNEKYPKLYNDCNHKPELAVALTKFEALSGFKLLEEISDFLKNIPEFCHLIDPEYVLQFTKRPSIELLQKCFSSYLSASPDDARKCSMQLSERLLESSCKVKEHLLANLFFKLNTEFPGDIGIFSIYFLNHVKLEPGEAIYIHAGLPHAYLEGDCIEVMARSDNVIRAGLTPKVRDVDTLLKAIDYRPINIEDLKFSRINVDRNIHLYKPPVEDFALKYIEVPELVDYTIPVLSTASILIVLCGNGKNQDFKIETGVTLFLPAEFCLSFRTVTKMQMYQAFCNL